MVRLQVITASRSEWIVPFTGLEPGQFRKVVRVVAQRGGEEIADGRPGRQWRLDLADRVLLVATYWRTNLTMRIAVRIARKGIETSKKLGKQDQPHETRS